MRTTQGDLARLTPQRCYILYNIGGNTLKLTAKNNCEVNDGFLVAISRALFFSDSGVEMGRLFWTEMIFVDGKHAHTTLRRLEAISFPIPCRTFTQECFGMLIIDCFRTL